MADAAIVPVKRFRDAKQRLAGALSDRGRADLARWMASRTLVALCAPSPLDPLLSGASEVDRLVTYVACDDPEVAEVARAAGAEVLLTPGLGLNGAIRAALAVVARQGHRRVTILHADLARPESAREELRRMGVANHVVLVPDRRGTGTNALSLPLPDGAGFPVAYGRGSFARHLRQASEVGLSVTIWAESPLTDDLDLPADLVALSRTAEPRSPDRAPVGSPPAPLRR